MTRLCEFIFHLSLSIYVECLGGYVVVVLRQAYVGQSHPLGRIVFGPFTRPHPGKQSRLAGYTVCGEPAG